MDNDNVFFLGLMVITVSVVITIAFAGIYDNLLNHQCRMDPICQISLRCEK